MLLLTQTGSDLHVSFQHVKKSHQLSYTYNSVHMYDYVYNQHLRC